MPCRHDDKFDSQKLILLRTFNWCAASHDRYFSKDGMIRRTDTSRYALYAQYLARDGHVCHWEATWNDTNSSTGQRISRPSQRGEGVDLERPETSRQQNALWVSPRYRR